MFAQMVWCIKGWQQALLSAIQITLLGKEQTIDYTNFRNAVTGHSSRNILVSESNHKSQAVMFWEEGLSQILGGFKVL